VLALVLAAPSLGSADTVLVATEVVVVGPMLEAHALELFNH
jgi:hypothetical protein